MIVAAAVRNISQRDGGGREGEERRRKGRGSVLLVEIGVEVEWRWSGGGGGGVVGRRIVVVVSREISRTGQDWTRFWSRFVYVR
jgi:hypothetical protein